MTPSGWIWEEREYNGTRSVADDDEWVEKIGKEVPRYQEPEKWLRNIRPLFADSQPMFQRKSK